MKKNYLYITLLAGTMLTTGCSDFLDLEPLDQQTEVIFFNKKSDFIEAAMKLHEDIFAWKVADAGKGDIEGISFDGGTDTGGGSTGLGTTPTSDKYFTTVYKWLRRCNDVIAKGEQYTNPDEIAASIGQAHFFRAWHHFFLVQRYGGVIIATHSADVDDETIVWGKRSSRYEVIKQVIDDLDVAIAKLHDTTVASTGNDGQVTLEAAKAFKARVCLYAGTWDKYVGTKTDGDGVQTGAGSNKPSGYPSVQEFLTMARDLSKDVMENKSFELWKGVEEVKGTANDDMYAHCSYYYLFNLEGVDSNPAGLDKSSNKEAIFRSVYDATNRSSEMFFTHSWYAGMTRKLADMYLCMDGLPVHLSPLFEGYTDFMSEYKNRDWRLRAVENAAKVDWEDNFSWNWGYGMYNSGADYGTDITTLSPGTYMNVPNYRTLAGGSVGSRKYRTELASVKANGAEAPDCMHIRLPEMYLTYAEAVCELGEGNISDADLNMSVNKVRERAGVAPLSAALIVKANQLADEKGYGHLNMLGEIRRERACELFAERLRFNDLCRWGIAEMTLSAQPTCGVYLSYKGKDSYVKNLISPIDNEPVYNASAFPDAVILQERVSFPEYEGLTPMEPGCVIGTMAVDRQFKQKNYLNPIPTDEIRLNPQLTQNPGW